MTTLDQKRLLERIEELIADGYLFRGSTPNTIVLLPKGLQVLLAAADRPAKKSKLVKESLHFERENTVRKKAE